MRAATVGIETGYQNPSIPIVMLTDDKNFQQPEGDLGAVMPIATAFFTPVPLYFWYLYIEIRRKCFKKGEVDAEKGDEISEKDGEEDEIGEKDGEEKEMEEKEDGEKGEDKGQENIGFSSEEKKEDLAMNGHASTSRTEEHLTTEL